LWQSEAFQAYADYALTPRFHAALDELRGLADEHKPAVMCAEAVWWRCHRRIVADYLLAAGDEVRHIMGEGKIEPHRSPPAPRRALTARSSIRPRKGCLSEQNFTQVRSAKPFDTMMRKDWQLALSDTPPWPKTAASSRFFSSRLSSCSTPPLRSMY
jgi:hypothetical protein